MTKDIKHSNVFLPFILKLYIRNMVLYKLFCVNSNNTSTNNFTHDEIFEHSRLKIQEDGLPDVEHVKSSVIIERKRLP